MISEVTVTIPIKELQTLFKIAPTYNFYDKTGCIWGKQDNSSMYNYTDSKEMKRLKALYKRLQNAIDEVKDK